MTSNFNLLRLYHSLLYDKTIHNSKIIIDDIEYKYEFIRSSLSITNYLRLKLEINSYRIREFSFEYSQDIQILSFISFKTHISSKFKFEDLTNYDDTELLFLLRDFNDKNLMDKIIVK